MNQHEIDKIISEKNMIKSKFKHKRVEGPLGRMYTQRQDDLENKAHFYSVTTILDNVLSKGIGFNKWLGNARSYDDAMAYGKSRANIGNITHSLCAMLVWGHEIDTSSGWLDFETNKTTNIEDEVKMRLAGFLEFLDYKNPDVLATEISLFNPARYKNRYGDGWRYPFAGTADYVMWIDDKLWIIDLKTGRDYPKLHTLQLSFYKILFDSLYAKEFGMKVDKLGCLYLTAKGKYKLRQYKHQPEYCYNLYDLFEFYKSNLYGKLPKFNEKDILPNKYIWEGYHGRNTTETEARDSSKREVPNTTK